MNLFLTYIIYNYNWNQPYILGAYNILQTHETKDCCSFEMKPIKLLKCCMRNKKIFFVAFILEIT